MKRHEPILPEAPTRERPCVDCGRPAYQWPGYAPICEECADKRRKGTADAEVKS
jgi:hypothetical protein